MACWSLAGRRPAPVPGWAWSGTLHSLVFKLLFFFGLFFSFNLKRRGQGQGRGATQGAAARIFTFLSRSCRLETTPGGGSRPSHHARHPCRRARPEPPPEVPSLDLLLTHTRAHTSTQLHQDDGSNNFTLSFFFFVPGN